MIIYLIILFAVTLVYFASAERLVTYIRLVGLQGLLLCGIAIAELSEVNTVNLIIIVAETLIFKAVLIPFLLKRIVTASGVTKVHRQAMPGFYVLVLSVMSLVLSVVIASSLVNPFINTIYLTVALYTLFTGLILIVTHRLIISHLIGFLIIENAVFVFSLAVGSEMPMHTNELTMLKD
jgi:hydrogenase-4 component E